MICGGLIFFQRWRRSLQILSGEPGKDCQPRKRIFGGRTSRMLAGNRMEPRGRPENLTSMRARQGNGQTCPLTPMLQVSASSRERALQDEVANLRRQVEMMQLELELGVESASVESPPTYRE